MSRIEWEESLSVENDMLDQQHQELFDHYNRLHEAILNSPPDQLDKTRQQTLEALVEYVARHFAVEEMYMKQIGFPGRADHIAQHRSFSERVTALQNDLRKGNIVLSSSLIKFMRNWIEEHIRQEDAKYATFQNTIKE